MSLLPLETLREKIGYHPYHFWQVADNDLLRLPSECNTLVKQRVWQSAQMVGRSEIQQAIDDAERQLRDYLQFHVAPVFETVEISKGFCWQHFRSVTLPYGKLKRIATPSWTQLGQVANVSYQDLDGDGINEYWSATFTVPAGAYDLSELAVRFQVSDCPANWSGQKFEIRPVAIEQLTHTTIKVSGSSWYMIAPKQYEGFRNIGNTTGAFSPDTTQNFVQSIELWQRTLTNVGQATLTLKRGNGLDPQSYTLSATILNSESGTVSLAAPCEGCTPWWPAFGIGWYGLECSCLNGYATQFVTISYESGANIADWETIVTRLALAELRSRICACEDANMEIGRWQTDIARVGNLNNGNGETFRVDTPTLGNPFGTRAGAVYAWNAVRNLRLIRAVGTASY